MRHYKGGRFHTQYHRFPELILVDPNRGSNVIADTGTGFRRGQVYRLGLFHPHGIEAMADERCDHSDVTSLPEDEI